MKPLTKIILSLTVILSFMSVSFAGIAKSSNAQLLFVMLAKKVALHKNSKSPKSYQLVLSNVNKQVIYFTNRPIRKTGNIPLKKFLMLWKKGTFKNVAPNAVIEAIKMRMKTSKQYEKPDFINYAVTLTDPTFNVKKNEVTFNAIPLSNQKVPDMSHADYTAVFIDNVNISRIVG